MVFFDLRKMLGQALLKKSGDIFEGREWVGILSEKGKSKRTRYIMADKR